MPDEIGIANANADRILAGNIEAARGDAGRTGPGAEFCEWCEAEIPAGRRAAMPGCTLCVSCQQQKERLKNG